MSSEKTHQMQKSKQATVEGRKHFQKGNYIAASDSFTIAVNNMPKNIRAWLGLGMSSVHLNKWTLAEKAFIAVIQIRPDNLSFLKELFPLFLQKKRVHLLARFGYQYLEMYPDDKETKRLFDWEDGNTPSTSLVIVACSQDYEKYSDVLHENGFKCGAFPIELLSSLQSDRHTLDLIVQHYLLSVSPSFLLISTKDEWTMALARSCLEQEIPYVQLDCSLLDDVDSNIVHTISGEEDISSVLHVLKNSSSRKINNQPLIRIDILSENSFSYPETPNSLFEFATYFYWMIESSFPFASRCFHLHFLDNKQEEIIPFEKQQFPFSYSFSYQEPPECFVNILGDGTILAKSKVFLQFIGHSNRTELDVIQPPILRYRVHGSHLLPGFLRIGKATADSLFQYITQYVDLNSNHRFLDWGCGSGRVLVFLRNLTKKMDCQLYGTDIDEEAIAWCRQNLNFARFAPNGANPPLPFEDNFFDVITANSIFTHLPENMQFRWLEELKRVTKSGAYLFLTIHGSNYQKYLTEKEFVFHLVGKTEGLPDWYQVAFHKNSYIHENWGQYFEIVDIIPLFCDGAPNQDLVICRNRG